MLLPRVQWVAQVSIVAGLRRIAWTSVGLALLSAPLAVGFQPAAAHAVQAPPAGLPQHFALGVQAPPDATGLVGWLPSTGVQWDFAYQYLSGGANTGSGWSTWNAPAGEFVRSYAQSAGAAGSVPFLTYYQLLQSNGPCAGCAEGQQDLAHLNDPSVMSSLYDDFTVLLKRLGPGTYDGVTGYGGAAVVLVEPDLSGYAQGAVLRPSDACFGYCTGQGNDPSLLRAAVGSSGNRDVAAFPDTYQGFNWAMLHLRDLYAPNVVLAFHISNWATGFDAGTSVDASQNPATFGQMAGAFAGASGVSQVGPQTSAYDVVTTDVSDRDAGYYKYVLGNSNAFWDRYNVALPNFQRWESYFGAAISAAGGKPGMVWQIPLGNQVMASMDNSWGHYQDNRVEYFLQHIDELQKIGVTGLLFGRGNDGSTATWDAQGDGVTNPPPVCTTDGSSNAPMCTNRAATVADDDGGYLRASAQSFYVSPPALRAPLAAAVAAVNARIAQASRLRATGLAR